MLKKIDLSKGKFEANGKTYYIQPTEISYNRLIEIENRKHGLTEGINIMNPHSFIYSLFEYLKKDTPDIQIHSYRKDVFNLVEKIGSYIKSIDYN